MSEITRAVLVGCGGISRTWLRAIMPMSEVEIVGLVDIAEPAARERAAEFGLSVPTGDNLPQMLGHLRPDVVFNCTIPQAHHEVTLAALDHGCHVLGEKPLADSMEGARQMIAAAQQAGRILAVIQNRRYNAQIRLLRHLVEREIIGPLTTVHCDFFLGAHFGGFRDHMPHVLLLDMAIHTFDAARLITGADPVSVYCHEWNPSGSWYDRDASAVATFEMSHGLIYSYRGSWCAEGLNTSWESDWRLIGTRGSLHWNGGDLLEGQVVTKTGAFLSELAPITPPPYDPGDKVGGHAGVIREFVRCVQQGGIPETTAADNIKSLAMVLGAIASAEQGQPVPIEI